jgi:NifU-like protein involved in Fe-S cluster formation
LPDPRYSAQVLDHFAAPRHAGRLPEGPGQVLQADAGEYRLGTTVRFALRIESQRVAAVAFRAYGCPHVLAACSLAAERLAGAPVRALAELAAKDLAAALDVPPEKLGRLLIVEDALRNGWRAWDNRGL